MASPVISLLSSCQNSRCSTKRIWDPWPKNPGFHKCLWGHGPWGTDLSLRRCVIMLFMDFDKLTKILSNDLSRWVSMNCLPHNYAHVHNLEAIVTEKTMPPRVAHQLIKQLQVQPEFHPPGAYDGKKNLYMTHLIDFGGPDSRDVSELHELGIHWFLTPCI